MGMLPVNPARLLGKFHCGVSPLASIIGVGSCRRPAGDKEETVRVEIGERAADPVERVQSLSTAGPNKAGRERV